MGQRVLFELSAIKGKEKSTSIRIELRKILFLELSDHTPHIRHGK